MGAATHLSAGDGVAGVVEGQRVPGEVVEGDEPLHVVHAAHARLHRHHTPHHTGDRQVTMESGTGGRERRGIGSEGARE